MSLLLSTLGPSLGSSIYNGKTINQFTVSCNINTSFCNARGSKYAAAAKNGHVQNTRLPLHELDIKSEALKQVVTNCSKLSGEGDVSLEDEDLMEKFAEVYSVLKWEILNDPTFEWTPDSRLWVQQMLDYNVPRGKMARGFSVVNSYKLLKEDKELSEDELFDASVVGWCIEWLEAASLILDDITDGSYTRRDQPCWFRHQKVGNGAVNNAILLMTHVPHILKKHFGEKPYYADLRDLFNKVMYQTTSGQMLDLITPCEEMDLSNYTMHIYRRIAQYKTGYLACYHPVACAMLIAGENQEKLVNMKEVLFEMGIYFQIMNDYVDCFGNPEKPTKVGTDIEDSKCSWLVVKALELANEEQKKIIHEHYGKANPRDVAKVKAVYNDINLQSVFAVYESELYEKLTDCVKAYPNKILHGVWDSLACYRELCLK